MGNAQDKGESGSGSGGEMNNGQKGESNLSSKRSTSSSSNSSEKGGANLNVSPVREPEGNQRVDKSRVGKIARAAEYRTRFDSADYNMALHRGRQSNNKRMYGNLGSQKKQNQLKEKGMRRMNSNPLDKSAAEGGQVLLRRALAPPKPELQRWDSADFFSSQKTATEQQVRNGGSAPVRSLGASPAARGRAALLNHKLHPKPKQPVRFDSADYYSKIQASEHGLANPPVAPQAKAKVEAKPAHSLGEGHRVAAQRRIEQFQRKRFDSADHVLSRLPKQKPKEIKSKTNKYGELSGGGNIGSGHKATAEHFVTRQTRFDSADFFMAPKSVQDAAAAKAYPKKGPSLLSTSKRKQTRKSRPANRVNFKAKPISAATASAKPKLKYGNLASSNSKSMKTSTMKDPKEIIKEDGGVAQQILKRKKSVKRFDSADYFAIKNKSQQG